MTEVVRDVESITPLTEVRLKVTDRVVVQYTELNIKLTDLGCISFVHLYKY